MGKKSKRTPDGHKSHSHGLMCGLLGCTKKKHGPIRQPQNYQVPDNQLRPGWSRGRNWSASERSQFPQGRPDESEFG